MHSGSLIKEIVNYLETNYLIFLITYIFIIMLQLTILYKKRNKIQIFLFILHKVIAFITIGYLLFNCKNILGFYLYIIGVLLLAFVYSAIKKRKILTLELFLIGDINLIVGLVFLLYNIGL